MLRANKTCRSVIRRLVKQCGGWHWTEDHDGIGRLIEDFGRGCEVLCVVSPVVEYVVQELQELTEFNEKKLKSTTDKGLNLAQRRRERRSRACAGRGARRARSIAEQLRVRMDDFARNHVRHREKQLVYVYL